MFYLNKELKEELNEIIRKIERLERQIETIKLGQLNHGDCLYFLETRIESMKRQLNKGRKNKIEI